MKIRRVTAYRAEDGRFLEYIPAIRVPGFSHRVIIDNKPVGWLSNTHQPNAKSAEFFFTNQTETNNDRKPMV